MQVGGTGGKTKHLSHISTAEELDVPGESLGKRFVPENMLHDLITVNSRINTQFQI